jgi:hypothetical protein
VWSPTVSSEYARECSQEEGDTSEVEVEVVVVEVVGSVALEEEECAG